MGVKERREREREQQRQKILDAALHIITTEGFAALSMRKLAERIEYSPASIYLYFENREQIAQELSEVGFQQLLASLAQATSGKEPAAALQAIGTAYVEFGVQHPEIYRLIFMGDSEYMTAAYAATKPDSAGAKAFAILVDLARQLKGAGPASEGSELLLIAEFIWSTFHGIVSLHITCSAFLTSSPEELVRLGTKTLASGLKDGSAVSKRFKSAGQKRGTKGLGGLDEEI